MHEERRAQDWKIGEERDPELRESDDLAADVPGAHERGQADAAEHEREAGGQLIGPTRHDDECEDQVEETARQAGRHQAGRGASRVHGGDEADHGADEHHAFEAEIDDARALAEQLRERRVEQRRAGHDRTR